MFEYYANFTTRDVISDDYLATHRPTDPFPPQWLVAPAAILDGTTTVDAYHCPSIYETFIAFGITNGIVCILSILAGCRPLLHFLTCHFFFKPGQKNKIKTAWILPLLLTLSANAILGSIIHKTPGYQNVQVYNVMMIYLIRPRLSMMTLMTFTAFWRIKGEYAWITAFLGTSIAELILQIIADIWVVATGISYINERQDTMTIIILMFVATLLTLIGVVIGIIAARPQDATGGDTEMTEWEGSRISNSFGNRFKNWTIVMFFILPGYLIGWMFFIMLLSKAEKEWCPPKLQMHVVVWSILAVVGTLTGAGM